MNADDIVALNEQIAGMARAGLPLDQGLESLARDLARGKLRRVTEAIAADLRSGLTLPEALERRKGEVPPYYGALVAAGVRTGRLPDVLATLTTYSRTVSATRTTVVDSLLYPAIVLTFGAAMFILLAFFVLPQFDRIFTEFGLRLPWVTEFVLTFGRHPVELVVVPMALLVGGLLVTWAVLRLTENGRRRWARLVYGVPVLGTLIRSARLAAFADLLAVLVEYELPLPDAFRLAGMASPDPVMALQAGEAADRLATGVSLGEAMRGRGLVPEWVAWMAGTGADRGTLGPTLRQIASVYHRQVESSATVLRSLFPPLVILFTAGFITSVFGFAVMLPMIKLLEGLSQ